MRMYRGGISCGGIGDGSEWRTLGGEEREKRRTGNNEVN